MKRSRRKLTTANVFLWVRVQFWRVVRVFRRSVGMGPVRCRCKCGYRCGGPGVCKLNVLECLHQETGHFVKDCEHDFRGPYVDVSNGYTSTCVRCTATSMHHDCVCGP